MKTNYFKYDLFPNNGQPLAVSIRNSLMLLIGGGNQTTRLNGSYYSIHHVSGDVFMFLKTNDTDIIKTIDRTNNSYQDIAAVLQANQEVAFASYLIAKPTCLGFGSTMFAPKIGAFAAFYDHFHFAGNSSRHLRFEPITKMITPAQALQFAHMGKINVKLEQNSPFALNQLTNFLGVTSIAFDDVDSFELVIKPKRMKNIKDTISPTLANMPAGVKEMTIAAKQAIGDQAVELHIATSGGIYDIVDRRSGTPIYAQMDNNFNNNTELRALGY
ncbi:hypothetical protein D3C79_139950 [compost metagenome]